MTEEKLQIELMRVKARETLFKQEALEKIKELDEQLQQKNNIIKEKDKQINDLIARNDKITNSISLLKYNTEKIEEDYKQKINKQILDNNNKDKIINNLKFQLEDVRKSLELATSDKEIQEKQYKVLLQKAESQFSVLANQLLSGAEISDSFCLSIVDPERLTKFISIFNKLKDQLIGTINYMISEKFKEPIRFLYYLKGKNRDNDIITYIENIRNTFLYNPNKPNTDIIFLLEYIFEFAQLYNKKIAKWSLYYPALNSILEINCNVTYKNGLVYVFSVAGTPDTMQPSEFNQLKSTASEPKLTSNHKNSIKSWFVDGKKFDGQKIRITGVLVPGLWDNDGFKFLVPPLLRGASE